MSHLIQYLRNCTLRFADNFEICGNCRSTAPKASILILICDILASYHMHANLAAVLVHILTF